MRPGESPAVSHCSHGPAPCAGHEKTPMQGGIGVFASRSGRSYPRIRFGRNVTIPGNIASNITKQIMMIRKGKVTLAI